LVQLRAYIARSMFAKKSRRTLMASLQDTTSTAGRLIAADQVQGTTIYNPNGDNLGSVEDVMIDKVSGKIAYAVVGFGGFLGIGNRHYPLPWEKLSYDPAMGGYVVDLDRSVLEGAPSYADNDAVAWNDRAWDEQVYDYYGARPYWDIMP
jgi:sporulation protein YlmC with PRC-barrel domain